jgi:hypothetical protein
VSTLAIYKGKMLCFCCSIDAKHPPLQHEVETPKYYCDNCDSTKDQFFIHQYGICQCCHDVKHGKYKYLPPKPCFGNGPFTFYSMPILKKTNPD